MIPEAGEETLQAVLNGDAEAFRSILRSYGPRVERLVSAHVLPHEVPEVAQETFVRAYRSLRSYQGQGSFERWLATIALRCCYERLRERYRPEAPFSSLARGEEDEPEGLTDQASFRLYEEENERRDLREELESALQSLEPRNRMLLTLTFLEGYSIAETGGHDGHDADQRPGQGPPQQGKAARGARSPFGKPREAIMNNLLQSLRGVLSALIGFPVPRGRVAGKGAAPLERGAYEPAFPARRSMGRARDVRRPAQPDGRSRCPGLAGAALPAPCVGECRHYPLCVDALLHAGDPRTALAEYAQSALAGYEVFF